MSIQEIRTSNVGFCKVQDGYRSLQYTSDRTTERKECSSNASLCMFNAHDKVGHILQCSSLVDRSQMAQCPWGRRALASLELGSPFTIRLKPDEPPLPVYLRCNIALMSLLLPPSFCSCWLAMPGRNRLARVPLRFWEHPLTYFQRLVVVLSKVGL